MSNLVKTNDNVRLTCLQKENVAVQELRKTAKSLGRIANEGACEKTKVLYKAKQNQELESSPEQLDILSVKEDNGQIMIEFRPPSTSAPPIAGTNDEMHTHHAVQEELAEIKVEDQIEFGAYSISVPSIHITGGEQHNCQTVHGGSTSIKIEDEVDIKIEDEMEFCALSSTAQYIPTTDDEEHNNKAIKDKFSDIKIDEMEFCERSISVQPISTFDVESRSNQTVENELTKNEDELEFCDEVEIDASNNAETTVPDEPGVSEGKKHQSEFICDICTKKYSAKKLLTQHRKRHYRPQFSCSICGVSISRQTDLKIHMRIHDTNRKYFTCEICLKNYLTQNFLSKHQKIHGKPNFRCTFCGVGKFQQSEMNIHMRTHETSRSYYTCDTCSKKYLTKHSLAKHQKLHGKPNFICNICGVGKFHQSQMNLHMRTHDTSRTYFTCDICFKKYSAKGSLMKHRKCHGEPNL